MRANYVIVFVGDMDRAVDFYRDVLEMPLRFASSHWTEFATDGAIVALHLAEGPDALADDLLEEIPGRCRLGLSVPDLDAFHRRMMTQEVRCLEEPQQVFGARVAKYVDPDGMPFSVGEETSRTDS